MISPIPEGYLRRAFWKVAWDDDPQAIAVSMAYFYNSAVVFGLLGEVFFWEPLTLIDIMLLGHWLEMRSVMGASKTFEELIKIMPSVAHLKKNDEGVVDIIGLSRKTHFKMFQNFLLAQDITFSQILLQPVYSLDTESY